MKKFLLILSLLGLTGCYTVLWLPDDELHLNYSDNQFYDSEYYGEYYDYYSTPWWVINPINIYSPSKSLNYQKDRDKENNPNNVRNENGERNSDQRTLTNRNNYTPPITTVNSNNQGGNSATNSNTNPGDESTSTNDDQTRIKSKSNNDSNTIRNESGNRNSGNSRR
jgi:hypothetical protein